MASPRSSGPKAMMQIAFRGERIAQLFERFGGIAQLRGRGIIAGKVGDKVSLGARRRFGQTVRPDASA